MYLRIKKIFYLSIILFFIQIPICGQNVIHNLGIGLNYSQLDRPVQKVFTHHIFYEVQSHKRLSLCTQIGMLNYSNKNIDVNLGTGLPYIRRRLMIDLIPKFCGISNKNYNLKIGIGVSFWHSREYRIETYKLIKVAHPNIPNQTITLINNTVIVGGGGGNLGYNFCGDLDINISKRISLINTIGFAKFKGLGLNKKIGITISFKL